jgi:GTPase
MGKEVNMLIDERKVTTFSGKGGNGAVTMRREKFVPFGGPDGGNGGNGASVIFKVEPQYSTLLDIGDGRIFKGDDGMKGDGSRKIGRSGKTRYIGVPRGTLIKNEEGQVLADLTDEGQEFIGSQGGRGGRGNATFKSSVNQAPEYFTAGVDGIENHYVLELKMMADVGLVGFPNAGKSSLVNKISSGKPKVGAYPFTTLEPVLGIVQMQDGYGSFVIADIPGLLEGASEGRGLGIQFLKHIERTTTLLFVIDGFEEDAFIKYKILLKELENFHPELIKKERVIALNKMDLGNEETLAKFGKAGVDVICTSAVSGTGCKKLIRSLEKYVKPSHDNKAW